MNWSVTTRILRTRRVVLAIWCVALVSVVGMYVGLYPSMEKIDLDAMVKALPPALVEALGYDDMASAAGYVGSAIHGLVGFFLLMVFAIMNGAQLIAGEEQDGALELELTAPLPRSSIYLQRLAALLLQCVLLVGVMYVGILLVQLVAQLDLPFAQLLKATLMLLLTTMLFGVLSFAAGAASGRKAVGLGVGVGILVFGFMANAIGPMVDQEWMTSISPVSWYMKDNPVTRDIPVLDVVLLVVSNVVIAVLGGVRFVRRDLMSA